MKRLISISISVAVIAAAVLAAVWLWPWDHGASGQPTSPAPAKSQAVRVEVMTPQPRTSIGPAQVEPFERVEVVAKISGYLESLGTDLEGKEINTGSRVRPGQLLATISIPEMNKELLLKQATVKEAGAAVEATKKKQTQAEKDLGKYTADLAFWDEEVKRHESLFRDGTIDKSFLDGKRNLQQAARSARDSAEAKVAQLQADLAVAQARVESARFDAERVAELCNYATVKAPVPSETSVAGGANNGAKNGGKNALYVVARRWADAGTYVQPGSAAPGNALMTLVRVDTIRIVTEVFELDSARVELGDKAVFQPVALPGQEFTGKVSRFSSTLDAQTRTMRVEIDLSNANGKPLYPGMYGEVKILVSESKKIVTVPPSCIHKDKDGASFCYCVEKGKANRVSVSVGLDDGTKVEVLRGLGAGSQVIRQAFGTLRDGEAIEVSKAK